MTRTLRPRKSKPSYVSLTGIELDDEGAGPSKRAVAFDEDVDSGSDFAPDKDAHANEEEEDDKNDEDDEDDMEAEGDEDVPSAARSISVTASRRSVSVAELKPKLVRAPSKPSLSRASKRQMYVLPTPSVHHRHRAVPLHTRTGRVERLETQPVMFKAPKITITNNFTQNAKVADRVNKSWGYNVGPGPIWELVEDRGWYKEEDAAEGANTDSDGNRRPKVHKNVVVKAGWKVLNIRDAAVFLPTDAVITEDGNLKPPPPVTSHKFKQYLAVAPFPTGLHSPEIGVKVLRPSHACIQIWSLGPAQTISTSPQSNQGKEVSDHRRPRKLGLLSGVFEDGSWSIYVVPYPEDVRSNNDSLQPVYVKLPEPLLRIELEETSCWTFDWANSEQVAIGTTNGVIAIYDLGPYLKAIDSDSAFISNILPTHYLTIHQSAIRALAWIRAPPATSTGAPRTDGDPTVIASGGYDGMECMTDIREGHGSVMNRTRDVINAMAFSPFGGGPVTIDHENIVKAYSASPSMLGRGHTLLEPQGPVWETQDRPATKAKAAKAAKPKGIEEGSASTEQKRIKANSIGTGAWPREVGVHRVIWNSCNGLASCAQLASATASGLCRVDELWGRWIKGKIPYGGIEHIRNELDDDAMDVDGVSDDSAGSS
ncbi:hypothetical protein H0H87_011683 [Tephrocybe sp. NHM501043]|nr:hypothetical protein H0H87_011683 [Tephrocybe sp. NHM501043]